MSGIVAMGMMSSSQSTVCQYVRFNSFLSNVDVRGVPLPFVRYPLPFFVAQRGWFLVFFAILILVIVDCFGSVVASGIFVSCWSMVRSVVVSGRSSRSMSCGCEFVVCVE